MVELEQFVGELEKIVVEEDSTLLKIGAWIPIYGTVHVCTNYALGKSEKMFGNYKMNYVNGAYHGFCNAIFTYNLSNLFI